MIQKTFLSVMMCLFVFSGSLQRSWSADIAVIIVQDFILPGDDPANDIEAKDFTFVSISEQDPGLFELISHMEEVLGHNVKLYGADEYLPEDVIANNDLVWITEEPQSSATGNFFAESTIPVIFQEAFIMDDMGLATSSASFENNLHTIELRVLDQNHPLTQGLPETFIYTVTNEETGEPQAATVVSLINNEALTGIGEIVVEAPVVYNTDAPDAPILNNVPVVIAVDEGTVVDANLTTSARWVMFGYSESNISDTPDYGPGASVSSLALLSETAWQLLDQTIAWALGETVEVQDWQLR